NNPMASRGGTQFACDGLSFVKSRYEFQQRYLANGSLFSHLLAGLLPDRSRSRPIAAVAGGPGYAGLCRRGGFAAAGHLCSVGQPGADAVPAAAAVCGAARTVLAGGDGLADSQPGGMAGAIRPSTAAAWREYGLHPGL